MNRVIPPAMMIGAGLLMILGWSGKLPHEMLGLTTADLLGFAIVSFIPLVIIMLLVVIVHQNKQIKEGVRWTAWRLGEPAPPQREQGRVLPFRRRSG